jgi:hypothetical protein
MGTPYLAIPHIQAAQDQKEVTANEAFDLFDASINAQVPIPFAVDADLTLTQAQLASGGVLKFTGAITADRYVNVPAIDRTFIVRNSTTGGFNLIVQVAGAAGASVPVSSGTLGALYCDSVDVIAIGGGGGGTGGGGTGGTGSLTAYDITPTGTIDGTNPTFRLPNAPNPPASLQFFKNGRKMYSSIDFTLSGLTITYLTGSIPQAGTTPDVHIAGSYTY